jgi:hypothetical protein
MIQNSLFEQEIQEKQRVENLCAVCGKEPRIWDINIRDRCEGCNKNYFLSEFSKCNLDENGFKVWGDIFVFYSHTTGKEEVKRTNILRVFYGYLATSTFPYCVQTCDDDKVFKNCLGITKEFAEFLIKELKLQRNQELDGRNGELDFTWINRSIEEMSRVYVDAEPSPRPIKLISVNEAKKYNDELYNKPKKKTAIKKEKNQESII